MSFHDDHDNVNAITLAFQGANTLTVALPAPVNKQVGQQYTLYLNGDLSTGDAFRPGKFVYSISAVAVSGLKSSGIEKTVTLQ